METTWLFPAAMAVALLADRLFGEPPAWAHPVVAMGRYLGAFKRGLPALAPGRALAAGGLLWLLGAVLCVLPAWGAEALIWEGIQPWRSPLRWGMALLFMGLILKPLLAWRMLREEVVAVEHALQTSLEDGRARLSRLVSRDTRGLSDAQVREAAIETLAENLNDSVVAPLFWFAVAGLPGAALYRFANTADAMWGYRGPWEWAGKCAARLDDLLSFIPARITGLLMLPAARWPALWRESRRTPSPNGGWPMGAMALHLALRLGKPGVYVLNEAGREPAAADISRAIAHARLTLGLAALLLMGLALVLRGGQPW
ncbi:adenosylcobinamide-phosphate synthase CbiB [Pelomonas sp. APW6]|uniref:Cobalamin biosynthesis protein CobD n=1 Tax=Roseateles subflavus TaxID=3053353 RepID=A0ABT7LFS1_9BURK|nr:adenosylcobinamide-phosphate synthase CbiB [Pelomonas sp. APW6]MDL5031683.1 adenosylcobinamide-phosphate synthase CbiB [Pelomonas sp. APW6]